MPSRIAQRHASGVAWCSASCSASSSASSSASCSESYRAEQPFVHGTGCFQQCSPKAIHACVPAAESCAWRCPPPPPLRSRPPRPAAHPPAVCTQRACRPWSTQLSLPAVPRASPPHPTPSPPRSPNHQVQPMGCVAPFPSPPFAPCSLVRAPSSPLTGVRGILTVSWVPTDV